MIWFGLVVIIFSYYLYKLLRWYTNVRRLVSGSDSFPTPPKNWLFGNLVDHPGVNEAYFEWMRGFTKEYGPVFRLFHGMEPQIYLAQSKTAKEILRTGEPKPMDRMPGYCALLPWLGNGLLLSNGAVWHRNRRLLTQAFTVDMLKTYLRVFNQTSETFVRQCEKFADSGEPVDVFRLSLHFSLDSLLQCFFSDESDVQELGEKHHVVRLTHEALDIVMTRCMKPYLWPDFIFNIFPTGRRFKVVCKEFNDLSRDIIHTRKCELELEKVKIRQNLDFLDMLLTAKDDDGKGLTEDEIRAEVNTFLFAGHDTTASTTSWTLYRLARHLEHQDQCRQEINDVFPGRNLDTVTWDDVARLNYVTMCMKEAMRLHTVVPLISRKTNKKLTINGQRIPKGILVNVILYLVHRDPDVWKDPDEYIPERFHPDAVDARDSFSFVPFSAGPRNCIGQNFALNEVRVGLAKIIKKFRVTLDESRPPKMVPAGVMRAENGIWLNFERIKKE